MKMYLLTDTCFWLGLLDEKDQYHEQSKTIYERGMENNSVFCIPWPCLYETVSTRLIKNKHGKLIGDLERILKNSNIEKIDDKDYKEKALEHIFDLHHKHKYRFSLVDAVIREIIADNTLKFKFLISYNYKDFEDICRDKNVEIIN